MSTGSTTVQTIEAYGFFVNLSGAQSGLTSGIDGLTILSQSISLGGTVASFYFPGLSAGANLASIEMSIVKISIDGYSEKDIQAGDVLSLTGATVGIIAAGAAAIAGGSLIVPAAVVAGALQGFLATLGLDTDGNGIPDIDEAGHWLGQNLYDWLHPNDIKDYQDINRDGTYRVQYYRDPLVLDLNGDGIQTRGTNKYDGVLFDHSASGISTATGWISPEDGLLVLDRDNNGTIDGGTELFGDSTVLANGEKAAHGFAALADLDSNSDGKVDADDARFAELKVWRDTNQDGASTAEELFTLNDLGIAALNTNFTNTNTLLTGNNVQTQTGTFTRTDGTTSTLADLNLVNDPLYSHYTTPVEIPESLSNLPNLKGFGTLRDLREAAALSPALATLLTQYAAATSKTEQKNLLGDVLLEWAKTSPDFTTAGIAVHIALLPTYSESSTNVIWLRPGESLVVDPEALKKAEELTKVVINDDRAIKIRILDAFTGLRTDHIFPNDVGHDNVSDAYQQALKDGFVGKEFQGEKTESDGQGSIRYTSAYETWIRNEVAALDLLPALSAYNKLADSVYDALLVQTRLKPYLDSIELNFEDSNIKLDFSKQLQLLSSTHETSPQKAFVDIAELSNLYGATFQQEGWDGQHLFATWAIEADQNGTLTSYLDELGLQFKSSNLEGTSKNRSSWHDTDMTHRTVHE